MKEIKEIKEEKKELLLEVKDDYELIEKQYKTEGELSPLVYSHYIIKYKGDPFVAFNVPKPFGKTHPYGTTAFLQYQDSVRPLMRDLFKILTKQQDSLSKKYTTKDANNLEIKVGNTITALFLKKTDFQVGAFSLGDAKKNEMLAQNFVDSFNKEELTYSWGEIVEEL